MTYIHLSPRETQVHTTECILNGKYRFKVSKRYITIAYNKKLKRETIYESDDQVNWVEIKNVDTVDT